MCHMKQMQADTEPTTFGHFLNLPKLDVIPTQTVLTMPFLLCLLSPQRHCLTFKASYLATFECWGVDETQIGNKWV